MKLLLLLHTVRYLKFKQIAYQLLYRIYTVRYKHFQLNNVAEIPKTKLYGFIEKKECFDVAKRTFSFINITAPFASWNETTYGTLWTYNLNYMDWLCQKNMDFNIGSVWIDKFIADLLENKYGLDSYPIALRSINWIKFIIKNEQQLTWEQRKRWNDSLYSQIKMLSKKLEYHLLGNHLLEDLFALYFSSIYFHDEDMFQCSSSLLSKELDEEILNDGGHFEQSPMYHCILLDRLLDCYNISSKNIYFNGQEKMNVFLLHKAQKMLGFLQVIKYSDDTIPLLNDSSYDIAPTPQELFDYADRLSINHFCNVDLSDSGYRKYSIGSMEAIVDVGDIKAHYQPGHTHADTFNFELRINGRPYIVDTGISTYNKTKRRQYERSTSAHNTVIIMNKDSSEVWGGFRVGKRAKVWVLEETHMSIKAFHNGFSKFGKHYRTFEMRDNEFFIHDHISSNYLAKSILHLAPSEQIICIENKCITTTNGQIFVEGAKKINVLDERISIRYNQFKHIKKIEILFNNNLTIGIHSIYKINN